MAGQLPESSLSDMVSSTRERSLRDCHDPIPSHTRDEHRRDDNDVDVKSRGCHEDKGHG
jgi:hypothetical protein